MVGVLMNFLESINDINKKYPIISSEAQLELIKKWKDHEDKEALDKLILSNIKAVLKEAYRTKKSNPNISHEDLIQEGLAGLLRAVEKFDAKQNVTFLTYATWWIKANIRKHVLGYRSVVKLGTTRADRIIFSNFSSARKEAEELGLTGEGKLKKIAEILGVNKSDLYQMSASLSGFDVSLDAPVKTSSSEESNTLKVDLLKDTNSVDNVPLNKIESKSTSAALYSILDSLPEDERKIISDRFLSDNPKTLRDLGKEMKISREWVRKLEIKALDRMQKRLASQFDIRNMV
tara:strand:- start:1207 stop:2076 length:870 start_codon:yes stop_codon:yes gene_type:complete